LNPLAKINLSPLSYSLSYLVTVTRKVLHLAAVLSLHLKSSLLSFRRSCLLKVFHLMTSLYFSKLLTISEFLLIKWIVSNDIYHF
jgi:hypothetical protein